MSYIQSNRICTAIQWNGTNQQVILDALADHRQMPTATYDSINDEWNKFGSSTFLNYWVDVNDTLFIPFQGGIFVIPINFYLVYSMDIISNLLGFTHGISAAQLASDFVEVQEV